MRDASSAGDGYERLRDRGIRALTAGNLSEAIEALGDAVCLRPDLAAAHLDLGRCFQVLGRTEVARRIYEHAGRTDPASPLAADALAGLPAKPPAKHAFDLGQTVRSADNTYRVLERRMGAHGAVSIVEPKGRSSFFDRVGYRRYVLKTFNLPQPWSDEDRERFANEAKTWVLLERHPNIVTALWVERVEHHHCLLLEYVSGGDLDTALAAGPLGLERALRFGLQFCDGMEHAARTLGVMHGDVKAANCLLTEDDTLKVTDFGLAQVFGPAQAVGGRLLELKPEVRAIYMVPGGTRNYRAPEQSRFGARVDVRTDIYGFGVLLYQMVTGDLPVSGSIAAEHIEARSRTDEFPAGLRELLLACVEREPQRRPRSFRGLRGELQAVYEIVARRPAPPPAQPLPGDRDLYIRRGAALDELGRHEEALAWFGKALQVAPGDGWALHNKALTLRALGRLEEALTCLDQALERYPGYTQALNAKLGLLTAMGRHEEARQCMAQLRKAPGLMGLGDLADALGHVGKAVQGGRRDGGLAYEPGAEAGRDASRHSPGAALAWQIAAVEAKAGQAPAIEPAHLMLGVCKLGDTQSPGPAAAVLSAVPSLRAEIDALRDRFQRAGLDVTRFRRRLRTHLTRSARDGAHGGANGDGAMHRTPAARGVFHRAEELSAGASGATVGLVELLRALLEMPAPPWGELAAEMGLAGRLRSLSHGDGGPRSPVERGRGVSMTSAPYSGGVYLTWTLALGEAALGGADEIEPAHFLLGICKACEIPPTDAQLGLADQPDGEVRELKSAFERAGLDTAAFRRRLRAQVARDRAPRGDGVPPGSATARELFSRAEELAAAQHGDAVELSHLLSAVLETPSPPWAALAVEMGVPDLRGSLLPRQPEPGERPQPGGEQPGGQQSGGEQPCDRSARVAFTVLQGPLQGRKSEFHERTTCVVGRADDCTLRLPQDEEYSGISRHHCLLDINPPDVRVRDLGSFNGTYVNGVKIGQRDAGRPPQGADQLPSSERELEDGDEIRLGDIRLRVGIRLPTRCATCGRTVREAEEPGTAGHQGAYRCRQCLTTEITSSIGATPRPDEERTCAACGVRLGAEHLVQPFVDELCAACKGDPERVMRQLLQVAEDGTRNLDLFGGYTIQRQLGQGGMGAVYLARDHQTDELCALKVMLPQAAGSETAKARFLREMSTVEMLRHPHLVRLHDHGCWNGIFFFVMDYCDGGDVAGLVHRRGGRLPETQALDITLQVLDGLAHAHQAEARAYDVEGRPLAVRGLVHRDLSPRNIFLDGGIAKIGDFGLAKAFDAAGLSGLTHTGTSAGSPSFVSKQQVLRFKRAQPEVDVWAAAACLYYMLTGSAPRDFPPHLDRWRVVLESPAVPVRHRNPEVPERLAKVIDHALTEHPGIGFTTAAAFRRALEEARV